MVRTSDALISGDFERYLPCFGFPTTLESFEGNRCVTSPDELRQVFADIRQFLHVNSVTGLPRKAIDARFADADTMKMVHETYILSGSTLIGDPIPVFSVIKRIDGAWRIVQSAYAVTEDEDFGRAVTPPHPSEFEKDPA